MLSHGIFSLEMMRLPQPPPSEFSTPVVCGALISYISLVLLLFRFGGGRQPTGMAGGPAGVPMERKKLELKERTLPPPEVPEVVRIQQVKSRLQEVNICIFIV